MIIGFGFGSPLMALLMLIITGFLSYSIFKALRGPRGDRGFPYLEDEEEQKRRRREYYYAQRERARQMMREFDLTNEEIERRVEEESQKMFPK